MGYEIKRFDDYPAMLITYFKSFKVPDDLITHFDEATALLDAEPQPITAIVDMRAFSPSFADILNSTKHMFNAKYNLSEHRNVYQNILITNNTMMRRAVDMVHNMNIVQNVHIVATLDEALAVVSRK